VTPTLRRAVVGAILVTFACGTENSSSPDPTAAEAAGAELRWTKAAPLPTPRTELAVAALDGKIYAAGGFVASGSPTEVVEAYDPSSDKWGPATPLPSPRHHAALVGASGRLYVVGGYDADGNALADVASWAPGESEWKREPPLPTARGALAAAVVAYRGREFIHAVAGGSRFGAGARLVAAHEVFDTKARSWTTAARTRARDHLAATGAGGKLYVTGGRELSLARNKAWLDIFDPAGTWQIGPEMPTARGGLAAAAAGEQVFVFGGEQPSGTFGETEFYEIATAKWFSGPDMPTSRHGLGAATIGDRIYVVGGGPTPGLSVSGANEVLEVR
jgi:hypothetical protein